MTQADPLIGKAIGGYVVDDLIGEGGMGRVYRAHRQGDDTVRVALKVLIGDLAASHLMRQRFTREAEAASKLSHENIVGVRDFGVAATGLPYLVMDLVEGTTLAAELHRGPIAPDRVIKIARQLCAGLDHAHSCGVIHRDFKPDNILVVGSGDHERFRIADFGLALSTSNETRLTTTGVACTPAYAAPEQLRGGTIDSRVDLYALGTTMFEMLTGGMLPFDGDLQGTIRSKLQGEAPSLLMIVPEVTPALATLVARLLEHSPERRPRSARSVIVALDTAVRAPKRVIRSAELAPQAKGPVVTFPAPRTTPKGTAKQASVDKRRVAAIAAAALMGALAIAGLVRTSSPTFETAAEAAPKPLVVGMTAARIEVTPIAAPAVVAADGGAAPVKAIAAPVKTLAKVTTKKPTLRRPLKALVREKAKPVEDPAVAPVEHDDAPSGQLANPWAGEADEAPAIEESDSALSEQLANHYSAVGRDLEELEMTHGSSAVTDLWPSYRHIQLDNAMATPSTRDEANAVLMMLDARIAERRTTPTDEGELP
ncbi:MAG: serine/threonine protein kinase [Kofleriaceae bacterium]|nr:serine/threonine protein kinase [Kofleriaceae bacterium]